MSKVSFAQALARHKAAQAALDAVPGPEDYSEHLCDGEDEALDELAFTPCASDAEFLEKLCYLYAQQAKIWEFTGQWRQLRLYRHRRRMSLLSGERMTPRLRYRILKCRAFVSIFPSRLSVWSALPAKFAGSLAPNIPARSGAECEASHSSAMLGIHRHCPCPSLHVGSTKPRWR